MSKHCTSSDAGHDKSGSDRSSLSKQLGGTHYKKMSIQPIEFIQANGLGYCEGNVIKYITRYKSKGGKLDLLKAIHYIELLLEDMDANDQDG